MLKQGRSLTVALDEGLVAVESTQDKAFVQALCYGVCRYYYRLEFILNKLLAKPLKNKDIEVKALALIGLYQLEYMRVKEHAAVSETVAAARKTPWAKSLLNAVLRRFLREQEQLLQQADNDVFARTGHPEWLVSLVQKNWPQQADDLLLANNQPPPMILRVNQYKTDRASYLQKLADCGVEAVASTITDRAIILKQPVAVTVLPEFSEGFVSVQDTAAQLAAELLDVQEGHRVLDMCAAPGGKTAHILESQPQLQELWAVDIDKGRLQRVEDNLQRLDLSAKLIVGDATEPKAWWDGQLFDRILVDAPCSALGVIRRHPDIKLLRREEDIQTLQQVQAKILQAAWQMLAQGGVMIYATCSVLKQENEQQMQAFMQANGHAIELVIEAGWGIKQVVGRQILTGQDEMDGFYYARICKR